MRPLLAVILLVGAAPAGAADLSSVLARLRKKAAEAVQAVKDIAKSDKGPGDKALDALIGAATEKTVKEKAQEKARAAVKAVKAEAAKR